MDTQSALPGRRHLRHLPRPTLILTWLLLAAALPLAAFDWQSQSYALLEPAAVVASAAAVTGDKYPDADSVRLDCATEVRYEADGTWFQVVDMAEKLLTDKGCRESRVLTSYYNSRYSRAKIPLVEVIRPDGSVLPVDLEQFAETSTETSQTRSNIYDEASLLIKVTVPALEPGDTLRVIYVDETLKPRVPGAYYDQLTLESTSPILHETIRVDAPEQLPLKRIALRNPVGAPPRHEERAADGRVVYEWEFRDIPQAFPEPGMPPLYQCGQHLLASTFESWKQLSRWYWELSAPHLETDEAIRRQTAALLEGHADFDGRVRAIFDFVSQQIRYTGIIDEDAAPGYEPHDVTRTYADRAGVCRDKAALLVAMMRAAGLEAFPVLIHTDARKDAEIPMPYFNHAISAVRRPEGGYLLMDATAENTRDLLPSYLSGCSYLVATPEGEELGTTPVAPYLDNLSRITSHAVLAQDGALELHSDILFCGIDDNAYRSYLLSATPEQRRQFFERQLSAAIPGSRLRSLKFLPADLQDTSEPLRARLVLEAPQALDTTAADGTAPPPGTLALLKLPRLGAAFGLIRRIFSDASLQKRRFPMKTDFTIGMAEELTVTLPDELQVKSLPEYTLVDTPQLLFSTAVGAAAGRISLLETTACKTVEFSPAEYQELKHNLKAREADSRKMPILEYVPDRTAEAGDLAAAAPDAPDAEILEADTTVRFEHANYWTVTSRVKLKVLTHQGVRRNSNLSFQFQPLCRTLEFGYARVTNGDQVQEPDPKMLHVLDESAGAAPRYPQLKRLVVNLPGVQKGSVIEYQITSHNFNRLIVGGHLVMQGEQPCASRTLTLDFPDDMAMETDLFKNGWLDMPAEGERQPAAVVFSQERDKENRRRIFRWSTSGMPACSRESSQLPGYAWLPTVIYSCGNWRGYAARLGSAIAALGDGGQAVAQLASRYDGLDEEERLRQICNWFDLNIRAAGPDFTELPPSALSRPETTLQDRYGNSADRAILLAALLRAAGFQEVGLFLASASPAHLDLQVFKAKYPTTAFSGTMLVRLVCNDREIWLNDQSRYLHFGTCAYNHGLLLSLQDGGFSRLELPPQLAEHSLREGTLSLDDEGTARFSIKETHYGVDFGRNRKYYAELRPEERRRDYQATLATLAQNAEPITEDFVTDFSAYPGTVYYAAKIRDLAVVDGDFCYLQLPLSPGAHAIGGLADRRLTPFYLSAYRDAVDRLTVELPPGFQQVAMLPASQSWELPGGGGTVKWECQFHPATPEAGATITATTTVHRTPAAIRPANYPELREVARQMAHPATATVMLKRTAARE